MDNEVDAPRWDISAHSPIIEQVISEFKFKLKYRGFCRLARNSCRHVYCFGSTKCLYIDTFSYGLNHLVEEVKKHYPSQSDIVLSIVFVDKYTKEQCFIELDNDKSFMVMLNMYNDEKEVTIYATTEKLRYNPKPLSCQDKVIDESDDENETDSVCPSQESYHSLHSSDNEYELLNYSETYAYSTMNPFMKVNSKFPSVIAFRRALNHYALTNEFEYVIEKSDLARLTACCGDKKCKWRIHASLTQDGVTFEVKKFIETHSCTRSNKSGLPCVHAAAFIAFTRDPNWDKYVDTYFTVDKFKEAYALEIGPMPGKDQWVNIETVEKIYPPIIKRPPGRPKKNRIIPHDEPKKRHRCPRCGMYGHHQRTCKNPASQGFDEASSSKRKEHKRS
ncbi:unnamed protein product [Lactuca virosa]|uniref:Transposase MuDR plant domain-containing protein n=1 Tax=Lactuca virosa TaxID=75947 RepID=A0AAU9PYT3_9ASTR|nr:unnamed protein product [Lactuca virosa]